jgi:hypothetical protein
MIQGLVCFLEWEFLNHAVHAMHVGELDGLLGVLSVS